MQSGAPSRRVILINPISILKTVVRVFLPVKFAVSDQYDQICLVNDQYDQNVHGFGVGLRV